MEGIAVCARFISYLLLLAVGSFPVLAEETLLLEAPSCKEQDRRVDCWLTLDLREEAYQESFAQWQQDQSPTTLGRLLICAAHCRSFDAYSDLLKQFLSMDLDEELRDHVLEEVSWGVLQCASHHETVAQRYLSLVGQMSTRDVRALPMLHRMLKDSSPALRVMAAQMAPACWTLETTELLERRWQEETLPDVRLALLESLGTCCSPRTEALILRSLESREAAEQLGAMQAYAQILGDIQPSNIKDCLQHARAGVRILGCLWAHRAADQVDLRAGVLRALRDPQPGVRRAAWEGSRRLPWSDEEVQECLQAWQLARRDGEGQVRIAAAKTVCQWEPTSALALLMKELDGSDAQLRQRAIEALMTCGCVGHIELEKLLNHHPDAMVRLNAGLGLLLHRKATIEVAQQIERLLKEHPKRLAPSATGGGLAIQHSEATHRPDVPNFPEALDLVARLRLAYVLAAAGFPLPQEMLERWLVESRWNVSSMSAHLLLSEGGVQAAQVVRGCLRHPDARIRFQSAMLLATFCHDEEALDRLIEDFPSLQQDQQWQVLDAAGSTGSRRLLPLLTQALVTPSPATRIIAASSILQVLYH